MALDRRTAEVTTAYFPSRPSSFTSLNENESQETSKKSRIWMRRRSSGVICESPSRTTLLGEGNPAASSSLVSNIDALGVQTTMKPGRFPGNHQRPHGAAPNQGVQDGRQSLHQAGEPEASRMRYP